LVLSSHQRIVGQSLAEDKWASDAEAAEWLYAEALFGLLAHDTSTDPRFVYANRTAQARFGYTWNEITRLPSRLSAVPDAQEDRDTFVRSVTEHGYARGYRGRRVTKTGNLFYIEDVTMWNLVDEGGVRHGQAAVFRSASSS
jgi:PAS domain-containing protein